MCEVACCGMSLDSECCVCHHDRAIDGCRGVSLFVCCGLPGWPLFCVTDTRAVVKLMRVNMARFIGERWWLMHAQVGMLSCLSLVALLTMVCIGSSEATRAIAINRDGEYQ